MANTIIKFFIGKKTFIVALLMLALGVLNHDNAMILNALGLVGLRLAIANK